MLPVRLPVVVFWLTMATVAFKEGIYSLCALKLSGAKEHVFLSCFVLFKIMT